MNKNGKEVVCKVCPNKFYLSGSRLGNRKYCSRECAKKDDYGFKPKEKVCKICGSKFVISIALRSGDKMCSSGCRHENGLRNARAQAEKKRNIIVRKLCRYCKKEVVSNSYCINNFCGGVSGECYKKYLSETRKGKNNPAYRNGFAIAGSRKYTGLHLRACSKYRKAFLEKNDYLFCEVCGVNGNATPKFEVHHIYYASLWPKHKHLHDFRNLILVCIGCHNNFHASKLKEKFADLEKERGLKELFGNS